MPPEAVLKEDLLRTGIAFDDSALSDNLDGAVKPKSYFIFSFDQQPLAELGEAATRRPPEEIALTGGPYGLRRTIVSVRVNPASPYRVDGRQPDARRARARRRRAAADARLLPARALERQDGDGDRADDPVGLPDLPDRASALPVLRREGGVPLLRHQPQLAPAQAGGPPVHGDQAGRGRARGAGDHRPSTTTGRRTRTRSPAARSPRRSTGSPRRTSTAGTRRRSRSASPAAGSARSSRRRSPRGRPALQGLRDLDLPSELRGLGRAALLDHLPRQGALRRAGGVAPADPRRGRGVRRRGT